MGSLTGISAQPMPLRNFSIDRTIQSVGSLTRALSLLGLQHVKTAFWPDALDGNAFPEDIGLFLQELRNKLIAFWLFAYADTALDLKPGVVLSLSQLASRASALGPYFSVWATEGISHQAARYRLARDGAPKGMLSQLDSGEIARLHLVPLNSGMSLALAESLLDAADRTQRLEWQLLREFIDICARNCSPGNHGIGVEALGLAARSLHPHLVLKIDATISQRRPDLVGYFWHGVGRAIYFSPLQTAAFWPVRWSGLDMCMRESPHSQGRANAIAGFIWALTLVNIRHPWIVAAFLNCRAKDLRDKEAFINGLCSALLVWRDAQPDELHLGEFLGYQPKSPTSPLNGMWKTWVQDPAADVLQESSSPLQQRDMGRLFCYRSFADLLLLVKNQPGDTKDSN